MSSRRKYEELQAPQFCIRLRGRIERIGRPMKRGFPHPTTTPCSTALCNHLPFRLLLFLRSCEPHINFRSWSARGAQSSPRGGYTIRRPSTRWASVQGTTRESKCIRTILHAACELDSASQYARSRPLDSVACSVVRSVRLALSLSSLIASRWTSQGVVGP